MPEKNLHQILGITPDASQAEIRAAYLKQAKQWHPDHNRGNELEAERRFKEIVNSYEVLSGKDRLRSFHQKSEDNKSNVNNKEWANHKDNSDSFREYIELLFHISCALAQFGRSESEILEALIQGGTPENIAREISKRAFEVKGRKSAKHKDESKAKAKAKTKPKQKGKVAPKRKAAPKPSDAKDREPSTPIAVDNSINFRKIFIVIIFDVIFISSFYIIITDNLLEIILMLFTVKYLFYKFPIG